MSLRSSSNGKLLYIYNAGDTIDLYDAATYKYLRTIDLTRDVTTDLFVVPGGVAPPKRAPRPRDPWARRRHSTCGGRSPSSCRTGGAWRSCSGSASSARRSPCPSRISRDLVDRALIGRDLVAAAAVVLLFAVIASLSFVLNVVSGLRYTRVSAEILFDMRLAMYRHLQRLSPRFYARTRLGDIMSRINNDIGEIQRVAAETALAWVGNVLFLIGTVVMLVWLDWRLFLLTARRDAAQPVGAGALPQAARERGRRRPAEERRHRQLPHRDAAGARLVVTSNAQDRESRALPRRTTRSSTR